MMNSMKAFIGSMLVAILLVLTLPDLSKSITPLAGVLLGVVLYWGIYFALEFHDES